MCYTKRYYNGSYLHVSDEIKNLLFIIMRNITYLLDPIIYFDPLKNVLEKIVEQFQRDYATGKNPIKETG